MPLDQRVLHTCTNPSAWVSSFLKSGNYEEGPSPELHQPAGPETEPPIITSLRQRNNLPEGAVMLFGHGRRPAALGMWGRMQRKYHDWYRHERWRFQDYGLRTAVETMARYKVLGAHVAAVVQNPDRLDLLGELIYTLNSYASADLDRIGRAVPALAKAQSALTGRFMGMPTWVQQGRLSAVRGYAPVALEDGKIEFFASVKDLLTGKLTVTTPGRYLRRAYPTLPDHIVRDLATEHKLEYTVPEVKIARSESECIRVVAEGPGSCMANDNYADDSWYRGHVHPAAVYGYDEDDPTWAPDTEILYIEGENGGIKARVICNAVTKACVRIYGDEKKMQIGLRAMGYTQSVHALVDARIRAIEDDYGNGYIMPYVDAGVGPGGGSLNYRRAANYFVLTEPDEDDSSSSTYCGYENQGVTEKGQDAYETCDCCGDEYNPDNMFDAYDNALEHSDVRVCEGCLDNRYREAVVRIRPTRRTAYVHEDSAIYVEDEDEYYHEAILGDAGIAYCEVTGEYHHESNMAPTPDGWVHLDHAVALDVPYQDEYHWTVDGKQVETSDGRTIYYRDKVVDTLDGTIYHCDDADLLFIGLDSCVTWRSLYEHIDKCSVLSDTLVIGEADRGAIPLREYMMLDGPDTRLRLNFNRVIATRMSELYDLLTEEVEECDEMMAA